MILRTVHFFLSQQLTHFKKTTFLNLIGLTVGMLAFILIMGQVGYEFSFDKFHSHADRIFRVETDWQANNKYIANHFFPQQGEYIQSLSPKIEKTASITKTHTVEFAYKNQQQQRELFEKECSSISTSFVEMFDLKMVEGESNSILNPRTILIPQSLALQLFGDRSAIGQTIEQIYNDNIEFLEIGGVYKDFPKNTIFRNAIYSKISENRQGFLYILLNNPQSKQEVADLLLTHSTSLTQRDEKLNHRLTLLPDVYFTNDYSFNPSQGDKTITRIFIFIAILIIAIAIINFINLSVGTVPLQIKNINIQKIIGCSTLTLRLTIIGWSVVLSMTAYFMALLSVFCLDRIGMTGNFTDMSFLYHPDIIFRLTGAAFLIGILAGIYPAFYSTSFPTSLVLKGSFAFSAKGKRLRATLIGFQFIISLVLIIVASFMNIQYHMLRNRNLGFDKDQIITVPLSGTLFDKKETYRNLLQEHPQIKEAAFAEELIANNMLPNENGEDISFVFIRCNSSLVNVLNIKIIEGRNFSPEDDLPTARRKVILNRKAQQEYNLKVGDIVNDQMEIVGITEDFNFKSLHIPIQPFGFCNLTDNETYNGYAYIKVNSSDYAPVIRYIEECGKKIDPNLISNISFLDTAVEQLYQKDAQQTLLITSFSIVAILISLVGVFGLILLETNFRKKEIGIRKVIGATETGILILLNRSFLKIILICFVIACPPAYYIITQWLGLFAYKIPISPWIFLSALFSVLFITLVTVTIQSYKAATANPIDAIKTE